jgi:hypothetical protein
VVKPYRYERKSKYRLEWMRVEVMPIREERAL